MPHQTVLFWGYFWRTLWEDNHLLVAFLASPAVSPMRTPFWIFRSILVPSLPQPRHAKHIYRYTPPTPPTQTRALSPGQKIAVFQPNPICGCCMVLWSFGHARATMLRLGILQQGGQKRATCCAHKVVAIVWPELANDEPTILGYIALRCCYRLAEDLQLRYQRRTISNISLRLKQVLVPNIFIWYGC